MAHTELIASLGMIAVDCAISPRGDLVVACHAGPPDWGSGPSAVGRLFKISYSGGIPQPVAAWAESETETIVEFDQPLRAPPGEIRMEFGHQVSAADRLEQFRPGYAVVKMQQAEPRFLLPVASTGLREDGRQLSIQTIRRTEAVNYALALSGKVAQEPKTDLAYTLSGVSFDWHEEGRKVSGWLPHLDLNACKGLATERHKAFFEAIASTGRLTMRCQLDLEGMLRPASQPGSKLDYEPGPEIITVVMDSDTPFSIKAQSPALSDTRNHHELTFTNGNGSYVPIRLEVKTPVSRIDVSYHTHEDRRPRQLGVRRFLAPFATAPRRVVRGADSPEIAGGSWENGSSLFFGKGACSTCHQIRGQGHAVGPDLSNLIYRDYASVLRDIKDPSATINPDAIAYTVMMRDGTEATGVRSGETESKLNLVAAGGIVATLKKADIVRREVSSVSLMPEGGLEAFSEQETKDLMTFLLREPKN